MAHLGEVVLVVRDYDVAIEYYVGRLGFELVEDTVMSPSKRWVKVRPAGTGGAALLLAKADGDHQESRIGDQTGGRVAFFLYTDDFHRDHARMLAAGVAFEEEPRHEAFGTVAVFADLYGNRWDFIERKDA
ncbi:VOC family protein [Phytomonospora endophytica]|uniref:Catechol 2,3-dioxygenase-like lactoylglutathione lyase family enzyme n=1 Tax=Phytomonospora endophytica TaxID=714109 RepID=A0A841FR09_9ACTN|nr:VOC family protein [Phytomonospora endophytica]MBB6034989.1 catechol 2,3-dioxygenase-like lactoylglutathione lyase family enzyme [Phytomonospora endophytica]GIG71430.1 extradiol dioxygenase [Phytomonospora endophytica]